LLARLDPQCRDVLGCTLCGKLGNPLADFSAVLVELRLPQEAGEHRAAQLREHADAGSRSALVSCQRGTLCVGTHGLSLLLADELRGTSDHGRPFGPSYG